MSFLAAQASAHEVTPRSSPRPAPLPEFVSWERPESLWEGAQERSDLVERLRAAEIWIVESGGLPLEGERPGPATRLAPLTHPADFLRRLHVARYRGRDPPGASTSPEV